MARIPLEDNYDDVVNKAQRGLGISDEDLARRAGVSAADLAALKSGAFNEAVARRVVRHLKLHPDSFVQLTKKTWYPAQPVFPTGFAAFNTACGDMTVNSYLVWGTTAGGTTNKVGLVPFGSGRFLSLFP
jgi:hypothetical protein